MDSATEDTEIVVKVIREVVEDRELATILFQDLKNESGEDVKVNLAESDVADIKTLFDSIFAKIYESKVGLTFRLDDSKTDLYNQVSKDIIDYLEKEVEQSRENFEKIWQLVDDEGEEE